MSVETSRPTNPGDVPPSDEQTGQKKAEWRAEFLSLLVYMLARFIGRTLRLRCENLDRLDALTSGSQGAIVVVWHGRSLIPANVFFKRGYWALISLSRDGEIQNRIFQRLGFRTVRGSTGRGGIRAAIQLAKTLAAGDVLAFTPDGPRGPSRKVQPGTIFLAQRSGCPIIPLGASARPRKLIGTWDRYMIPLPFARAAFIVGEPIYVAADADAAAREEATRAVEAAINACERRAETLMGYDA